MPHAGGTRYQGQVVCGFTGLPLPPARLQSDEPRGRGIRRFPLSRCSRFPALTEAVRVFLRRKNGPRVFAFLLAVVFFVCPVAAGFGSKVQYFAQLAQGGGTTTTFTVHNPERSRSRCDLISSDPTGASSLPFRCPSRRRGCRT